MSLLVYDCFDRKPSSDRVGWLCAFEQPRTGSSSRWRERPQPRWTAARIMEPPNPRRRHLTRAEAGRGRQGERENLAVDRPGRLPASRDVAAEERPSPILAKGMRFGIQQQREEAVTDVVRIVLPEVRDHPQAVLDRQLGGCEKLVFRIPDLFAETASQAPGRGTYVRVVASVLRSSTRAARRTAGRGPGTRPLASGSRRPHSETAQPESASPDPRLFERMPTRRSR